MGINLYTLNGKHIGKRSADGIWCWDCKIRAELYCEDSFRCPECYKIMHRKDIKYNPAFRELGFDKTKPKKKKGIDGASCFCWCIGEFGLGETIFAIKQKLKKVKYVKTEYNDKWTIKEFWNMFKDILQEKTLEGFFH